MADSLPVGCFTGFPLSWGPRKNRTIRQKENGCKRGVVAHEGSRKTGVKVMEGI